MVIAGYELLQRVQEALREMARDPVRRRTFLHRSVPSLSPMHTLFCVFSVLFRILHTTLASVSALALHSCYSLNSRCTLELRFALTGARYSLDLIPRR